MYALRMRTLTDRPRRWRSERLMKGRAIAAKKGHSHSRYIRTCRGHAANRSMLSSRQLHVPTYGRMRSHSYVCGVARVCVFVCRRQFGNLFIATHIYLKFED